MKLDKKTLKKLIVETLQEAEPEQYDPDAFQPYSDESRGSSKEDFGAEPKDLNYPEDDIAGYFRQVGDEIRQRIEAYEQMPKAKITVRSEEDLRAALNEMDRVKKELEDIKKVLQDLEKRDLQSYNDTDTE